MSTLVSKSSVQILKADEAFRSGHFDSWIRGVTSVARVKGCAARVRQLDTVECYAVSGSLFRSIIRNLEIVQYKKDLDNVLNNRNSAFFAFLSWYGMILV